MIEQITQIFNFLNNQDHILLWVSLFFGFFFVFIWLEKNYKVFLWTILGLAIFSIINLTLFSLNDNDIWFNFLRDFFINNRQNIWYYSIIFIPILAILLPLNSIISFKVSKNISLNYLLSFLFWLLFVPFFLSIFFSILNNKFLFNIDINLIQILRQNFLINYVLNFFNQSILFIFLQKYDYIVNLVIILFIFYKMTLSWIVNFIFLKITWLFKTKEI